MEVVWDDIVVGGGILGSWTAYHLGKHGRRVLLLDQFHLPHTRGSSHGLSRIIRMLVTDEGSAVMLDEILTLYGQLEAECGQALRTKVQLLNLESEPYKLLNICMATADKYGRAYEHLSSDQLQSKYPMLRYSDKYQGLLDPAAAMAFPEKCLTALRQCLLKSGGSIQDGVQVQDVRPGKVAMVMTNKGNYQSKNVVLTTGPWSKEILSKIGLQLPIKTLVGLHAYWKLQDPTQHNAENSPMFIDFSSKAPFYLFPSMEYPGLVKVGLKLLTEPLYCHPDEREKADISVILNQTSQYIQEHLPCVEPKPSITEPCMHTLASDGVNILDKHPEHPNIIIGTALAGDGFTQSPVLGKLLCELAMGTEPSYDITPFRINRFSTSK